MNQPIRSDRTPEEHARDGLRRLSVSMSRLFTKRLLPKGYVRHTEFIYTADDPSVKPGSFVTVTVELGKDPEQGGNDHD